MPRKKDNNEKTINETYSVPQYEILTSTSPITVFFGGYGAGKTKVMADVGLYYILNFPEVVGIIAANTYGQLTRSTLFRVLAEWNRYGITEWTDENPGGYYVIGKKPPSHFKRFYALDDYRSVISFQNGAMLFLASLDNYKSLDGMEVGYMLLDETKDTKREAIDVLIGRLRQKGLRVVENKIVFSKEAQGKEINPMYIFTAPSKEQWLLDLTFLNRLPKEEVMAIRDELFQPPHYSIREIESRKIVFAATHSNTKNLPAGYIEEMQSVMSSEMQELLIYGFPFGTTGGEFYKHFSVERHVGDTFYRPDLPLHLSFDENVVPYAPCGVWQVEGTKAYKIDEIDLRPPRNNIYELANEILRRYRGHKAAVYIYGDATSWKRDEKLPTGQNFYYILKGLLRELSPVLRVPKSNPPVKQRGMFLNAIFEKQIFGIKIVIDRKCENTINDYLYLKEAADGTKLKEVAKDSATGVSYQKYGHDSDLDEYFLTMYFNKEFRNFMKGGKKDFVDPLGIGEPLGGDFLY